MDLIAKCRFPYLTRHLVAGETFHADEKLGLLLVKLGRAKLAPAPAPTAVVAAPVAVPAAPEPKPEAAPAVAEVPHVADPEPVGQAAETPTAEEPAKPAFKTPRKYGSRAL